MIKNFVYNSAFIKCDIFQLFFIINNCLAYFIAFVIDLIRFKHFMIKKIIDNINVEFDVIKIQSIRCENNLMLLSQSFIFRVDKLIFNHISESINLEIL